MIHIHNGTIEPVQYNGFSMFRAQFGNMTEFFYTIGAATWWIEMLDTIKLSRARRNAR